MSQPTPASPRTRAPSFPFSRVVLCCAVVLCFVTVARVVVQGGVLSKLVTDEELTAANVLAVKTLVNVTQAYPGVSE